jgi:hypothetical protein
MSCGHPLKASTYPGAFQADKAKEHVRVAVNDAWETFKTLWLDPVGQLMNAYQALGDARAVGVGAAFGIIVALCFAISIKQIPFFGLATGISGFGGFIKLFFIGLVPFVSLTIGCYIGGKIGKGRASIASNTFIAGVALLPLGIATLVSALIGSSILDLVVPFFIISACLNVLLLFSGLTKINLLSEKTGAIAVPLTLIASSWISKLFYTILL